MDVNTSRWFIPNTLPLVLGLGINCTIGYGTLFYSFSLLSIELEHHFGWSKEFIFGTYSLGILLSGLAAPLFGKWIDTWGARYPMTIGSIITAITLLGLSQVNNQLQFSIALLLLEITSILVLYESAFVALTQVAGKQARLPITQITLMAGFASTIFWPAVAWVLSWGDWRTAYLLMALLHLLICLPVHWWVLKPQSIQRATDNHIEDDRATTGVKSTNTHSYLMEVILAFCLGFAAFTISSLQIHLFRITAAFNISDQLALLAGVLVGPFQVVARLLDMWLGRYITALQLGIVSFCSMASGLVLLLTAVFSQQTVSTTAIILFAVLFGAGQGLSYIVRGAIPLALFDPNYYGAITGRMNGVRMMMTAIAPFSFAIMMDYAGVNWSLTLLALILIVCTAGIYWLQYYEKNRRLL